MNDPENAADLAAWENEYTDGALASWETEPIDDDHPGNRSLEENKRVLEEERPATGCRSSWGTCLYKKACPVELECWTEQVYRPWVATVGRFRDRPAIEEKPARDIES